LVVGESYHTWGWCGRGGKRKQRTQSWTTSSTTSIDHFHRPLPSTTSIDHFHHRPPSTTINYLQPATFTNHFHQKILPLTTSAKNISHTHLPASPVSASPLSATLYHLLLHLSTSSSSVNYSPFSWSTFNLLCLLGPDTTSSKHFCRPLLLHTSVNRIR
jgi:hypothetical protein